MEAVIILVLGAIVFVVGWLLVTSVSLLSRLAEVLAEYEED